MSAQATQTGPLAPARLQQIREAARDKSSLVPLARALGVTGRADLACAPAANQWMCLSLNDLSTHMMVFGATGTGKTSSVLRPLAVKLKTLPEKIGAVLSDGKGAMVADMRALLDIVIEPGTKFAPFQGMDAETVAKAFNEATDDGIKGEAIWTDGADNFHLFALTILQALVQHEKAGKIDAEERLVTSANLIDIMLVEREEARRRNLDTSFIQSQIDMVSVAVDETKKFIASTRQFMWTPSCYSKIANILATPSYAGNGVFRANDEAQQLFDFLGYSPITLPSDTPEVIQGKRAAHQERIRDRPASIFPDLLEEGRVTARAIDFFQHTWPNTDEKQRSSFLINVNRDILSFLKSDKLRGGMMDGVDMGETAWADTEEGVDVLGVVHGAWLGVNLPETQFKKAGKIIAKLVKSKVFKAIQIRQEVHGEHWREATGQCAVMDMVDECQEMVSNMEIGLAGMARSMGLFFVYATQTYESLDSVMKSVEAKNRFLNNFRSILAFDSSEQTVRYLQGRAGKVKKLRVKTETQGYLDVSRAINTFYNTIYADPNHPAAHILRDMDRRGSTRFQVVVEGMQPFRGLARRLPLEEMRDQNYLPVYMSGKYEECQLLEDWEVNDQLSVRGTVIALLNRAGHKRIDFARTQYMSVDDVKAALEAHQCKQLDKVAADLASLNQELEAVSATTNPTQSA